MTPFSAVLALFEGHGWRLLKIVGSCRVFVKQGGSPDESYVIKVHEAGSVSTDAFERARDYLRKYS